MRSARLTLEGDTAWDTADLRTSRRVDVYIMTIAGSLHVESVWRFPVLATVDWYTERVNRCTPPDYAARA